MPSSGVTPQQVPRTPCENVGSGISAMGTTAPLATAPNIEGNGAGALLPFGASASMTSGGTAKSQVRVKATANTMAARTTYMIIWLGE